MSELKVKCTRCRNTHMESERDYLTCKKTGWQQSVCPRCAGTVYFDMTPQEAWCYSNGLIAVGDTAPQKTEDGHVIVIARGPKAFLLTIICVVARHGKGEGADQMLVPGIPEAANTNEKFQALLKWLEFCAKNSAAKRNSIVFASSIEGLAA